MNYENTIRRNTGNMVSPPFCDFNDKMFVIPFCDFHDKMFVIPFKMKYCPEIVAEICKYLEGGMTSIKHNERI